MSLMETHVSSVLPLSNLPKTPTLGQSRVVAEKLTGVFFGEMLAKCSQREELPGGFGEDMISSFLYAAIGDEVAKSDAGKQLTNAIERQILQLQEEKDSLHPKAITAKPSTESNGEEKYAASAA